tara:strand:- start:4289 stop:5266 length:978 start_codon:yes stop_codon:yes gene_type:complete
MDKLSRLFKLHQVLSSHRHPVSMTVLQQRLECSRATVARAIEEMRLYFGAPLEYVREGNGYAYVGETDMHLPGFWLSERELMALLTLEQIVAEIGPGILADQISPITARIRTLLTAMEIGVDKSVRRIVLGTIFQRPIKDKHFMLVAQSTLRRKRIELRYHNRSNDETHNRVVSPQRMVYYRDNWYLEAWCHTREDLRKFALDRIVDLTALDAPAVEIDAPTLAARFEQSYGIYSGPPTAWAVLRFSKWQSNWTSGEKWHPAQKSRTLDDGRYEIEVPYAGEGELIMDILSHVPHVEVVSPPELRQEVRRRLEEALSLYAEGTRT